MTHRDLDALLRPRSMVVVGASERPGSLARRLLDNIAVIGGPHEVQLVNPKQSTILGRPVLASVRDLAERVDVAVVSVPAEAVAEQVSDLADVGIRNAVIYTSGFAESSSAGRAAQDGLRRLARVRQLNLIGPNCMGNLNLVDGVCTSFTEVVQNEPMLRGPVSLVSQSGGVALATVSLCVRAGLGLAHVISTGNEADIGTPHALDWLAGDETTQVVGVYAEHIDDGVAFLDAVARLRNAGKAVIVLMSGRTEAGSAAAQSHTGSLATQWAVSRELLTEAGVVLVRSPDEIALAARMAVGMRPFPRDRRLLVIASSGGTAVLAADAAGEHDVELPPLSTTTIDRLRAILPPFAPIGNPLDVSAELFHDANAALELLRALSAESTVDALAMVAVLRSDSSRALARTLAPLLKDSGLPAMAAWLAGDHTTRAPFDEHGLAYDLDLGRMFGVFTAMVAANNRDLTTEPVASPGRTSGGTDPGPHASTGWITEPELKAELAALGLAVPRSFVLPPDQDRPPSFDAGPMVVKIVHERIPHRAKVGGIAVGVGVDELGGVVTRLRGVAVGLGAADARILVEELAPPGPDLFFGYQLTESYGPIVALGIGGSGVESREGVTFGRLPLTASRLRWMLERVPWHQVDVDDAQVAQFAEVVQRLSDWCVTRTDLVSVDLNPIRITAAGPVVLDALAEVGA